MVTKRKEALKQQLKSLTLQQQRAHAKVERLEGQLREQYRILKEEEDRVLSEQESIADKAVEAHEHLVKRNKVETEFAQLQTLTGNLNTWFAQLQKFKEESQAIMDAKHLAKDEATKIGFTPGEIVQMSSIHSKQAPEMPASGMADSFAQMGEAVRHPPTSPDSSASPASPATPAAPAALSKAVNGDPKLAEKMAQSQLDVLDFNLAAHEFMKTADSLKAWRQKGKHDAESIREGAELKDQLTESLQAIQSVQERIGTNAK